MSYELVGVGDPRACGLNFFHFWAFSIVVIFLLALARLSCVRPISSAAPNLRVNKTAAGNDVGLKVVNSTQPGQKF